MLKLKKVQILGFKSFCDRTEVQLSGEGIAAIVGPNGCGKSNISDAITWVLGEQSAKSLRGIKMEDVIFAGTRDRKPTGMAEVSLTLVDPDIYDGTGDMDSAPDLEMVEGEATDWDETALREQVAAETEEAVAEAQPGTILEGEVPAPTPESLAAAGAEAALPTPTNNVVLKIRRRKFGRSPIRAGELTITRRLFRSGDSEYLLNGKICRLRDIQDIFMGTGLGGESYAIIGQERIGQLLSAKPQDRRSIIEEAAGITRFKSKKRLAELRLESAKQNLARVNDIFEEVSKQIGTLKRQAAKAERYGQIRDELRAKLRVVLSSRIAQLDADQTSTTAQLAELTVKIDAQAADIESMDVEHTEGVRHGYSLDQQIREHSATANQSAVELERIAARSAANVDRIAELTARLASGAAEMEAARAQLAALSSEQQEQRSFLDSANSEAAGSRAEAQRQQQAAQQALFAVNSKEQAAEQNRRHSMQLMQRANQIRNEQAQAEAALAGLDRESERLLSESETARQELQSLNLQRGQAKLSFESVNDRLKRLEMEISELRLQLEAGRTEENQSKRRGDQLRGEVAGLNGRRQSLEGLIRDHSYSTDTVKNIFRASAKKATNTGEPNPIVGTLADFLEVDGAYEQVVDEFLRDELNYIVVKSWDAADDGIRLLKSDVAGRATFLVEPGSENPHAGGQESLSKPTGEGVKPLRECIRVLNGFGRSLEVLLPKLREGFVAPDSTTARTLALEHPHAWFLSPTGETFHHVTVTGGRPSSGGPLALKRELREITDKLAGLEKELTETDLRTQELQHELAAHSAALEGKNHERRDAERESANSGAALRQMESESARIERRLQDWMQSTDRNREARNQKADLIASRQQQATALESERAALEAGLTEITAQVEALRSEREQLQQTAAAAGAALAGLEERRRNAQANFEQTTRLYNAQQQRIGQLEQQLASAATEKQRREEETSGLGSQHEELAETRATAVAQSARLTAEAAELRTLTAALDSKLRALRAETEALREQRSHHAAHAAKLSSDLEHIEETCLNDLAIPSEELRADESIVRIEGEALNEQETESRTLKHRLEQMGPVNMMALEEFAEASQRHSFLDTQRKDLLDSISNTQASIKEIDDVSRVKFDEAYKIINENFSVTFSKLFGGGQAFMRLTDPDNPNSDSSGIEIVASPPGKKLQNILLLSGGEKALTALSLLVGIFQFQPAPFCILDEVDAPLDETNVGRYAKLISDMAKNTQFIAITHNKRTMAQADVIYGVTMQEPGISKIVSVNLGRTNRNRDQDDQPRRVA
ncbi:chromosome segregation protein SMC [Granulicella sp. WH15]|uniref:chromosome segregation protein SMC n=1 Tax=Granulicella sp. WH15 TaxID=2602070 RepID=UPI001367339B|nr:chromosome segregation protein SMC [Granulicella sp. WH15]QHN02953.1 chromosome segregation protein SMC [Granulicella sp. WH15]